MTTRTMESRATGRMHGFRITRQRLQEVMPSAETNPLLWFAWDDDDEPVVLGVRTKAELRVLTYVARARGED